jgi:hypothetical protein
LILARPTLQSASLNGSTSGTGSQRARWQNADRVCELLSKIPSGETLEAAYEPAKERIRVASYAIHSTLARVK